MESSSTAAHEHVLTTSSRQRRTPHPHEAHVVPPAANAGAVPAANATDDAADELMGTGPSLLRTQSALGRFPGGDPTAVGRGNTFSMIHLANTTKSTNNSKVGDGRGDAVITGATALVESAEEAAAAIAPAGGPHVTDAEHIRRFARANATAIELTWNNISVVTTTGDKQLLQAQSGTVHGRFLAIMGPSGSGKTSLMNVLACRVNNVKVSDGAMMINGVPYSSTEIKKVSGYVMQDDLLNAFLTVEETLQYAAELRLPQTVSSQEKRQRVREVLDLLGLTHVRDVIVGGAERKGISGGERKRLCVAMELLSRPRLLFLDEPTSGLDSVTSLSLCETLKSLADSGSCTVVCTIHQPQSKIFNLFDDLLLLKSGRIIYSGPAADVPQYFAEAGFPCPPMTNIADHIMDVIQPKMGVQSDESADSFAIAIDELVKKGKAQADDNASTRLVSAASGVDGGSSPKNAAYPPLEYQQRSAWMHQFLVLLHRSMKEVLRNRVVIFTQILQAVVMAVLIGTVFLNIGTGTTSVSRRQPVLFFCVINQGVFGALTVINSFPAERVLVLRERAAGMYYVSAYFLAKQFADMVLQVLTPVIFSITVYFIVGLQDGADKFFAFLAFMVLTSLAATSLALAVSALARTTSFSVVILPLVLEINRLFGGYFLAPANLPNYFSWLDALSYVKYAYVGISLNELHGLELSCVKGTTGCTQPETTITSLGLDKYTIGECGGALIAYIVGMRVVAYLAMRYIKW